MLDEASYGDDLDTTDRCQYVHMQPDLARAR